ncbi:MULTISPECIES: general stress protein [unclassified Leptolyngbya]|uniref:general stress protein n=1 Tax=unclassified Leptolyngbya TaxID=2650499 RepID=UPI0016823D18|nr:MULTISPECIES: general stress protein [unclassified Leptolyngbya]MBD1913544.1 hypothetical protein [Leptolyngbya sp. FACHB-8]MBD2155885.1 hypothetical protein [Leptolyngbya sp. FACHB-16]
MVNTRSDVDTARHRRAIGTFPNRRAAEHALNELRDSGFPMARVSILTKDSEDQGNIAGATHHTKTDEGAKTGAAAGGALGTITGLLVGLGTLAIPGIGPILVAGATATTLATTLAGTAIGAVAGSLLGALAGLGIPEDEAHGYHDRIMRGEYLVIVDGSDDEIAQAEQILHSRGVESYKVYDAPSTTTTAAPVAAPMPMHSAHPDPRIAHPITANSVPHEDVVGAGRNKHAIARFSTLHDAEAAVTELHRSGFPLSHVSITAKRIARRDSFVGLDVRDRFEASRYGIPADQAQQYDSDLEHGDFLLVVGGTASEINQAHEILAARKPASWQVYESASVNSSMNASGLSGSAGTRDERIGIDESARTGLDSARDDRTQPRIQKSSSEPEVIIIDHRKDPH